MYHAFVSVYALYHQLLILFSLVCPVTLTARPGPPTRATVLGRESSVPAAQCVCVCVHSGSIAVG